MKARFPEGIAFDLFGTLLPFSQRDFFRALEPIAPRHTADKAAFKRLLIQSFHNHDRATEAFLSAHGMEPTATLVRQVQLIMESWPVEPFQGVRPWLAFLKRAGCKLILVSNLAEVFVPLLTRSGLLEFFDDVWLSCREQMAKPSPELYQAVAERLSLKPEQMTWVGDHPVNDGSGPAAAGYRTLVLGQTKVQGYPLKRDFLPFLDYTHLMETGDVRSLLPDAQWPVELLSDEEQGRYNLMASVVASGQDWLVKRAAEPEAVRVEALAYRMMELSGLGFGLAYATDGHEPLLLCPRASGEPWKPEFLNEESAYQIGQHCACGFLIANADLRPRNTFWDPVKKKINVFDLEHAFFDRVLSSDLILKRLTPKEINAGFAQGLIKTKTNTAVVGGTSRTRKAFINIEDYNNSIVKEFKRGWVDYFEGLENFKSDLLYQLNENIYQPPYLQVGTRAYRRVLAGIDLEDFERRMNLDPEQSFYQYYKV